MWARLLCVKVTQIVGRHMSSTLRGGCVFSSLDSTRFSPRFSLSSLTLSTDDRATNYCTAPLGTYACVGVPQLAAVCFTHVQLSSLLL